MSNVYLCSMGANLAPQMNFAKAQDAVAKIGQVQFSRAIYTEPVAIQTQHKFLNALFLIHTELSTQQLKQRFNEIEEALGRDRSDPQSSQKDRPMDIDILGNLARPQQAWHAVPEYLHDLIRDLEPATAS